MDFTREPVIETVISSKEGSKLVVRNSKVAGSEEYFVDAIEVICFGQAIFFRCSEKPKPFLVPASDYEVLEAKESRMVLKNVGNDRSIKIGGGRESNFKSAPKETHVEKVEAIESEAYDDTSSNYEGSDKRKDKRKGPKKKKGPAPMLPPPKEEGSDRKPVHERKEEQSREGLPPPVMPTLLAPPPLISETIERYKEQFKEAFYTKEASQPNDGEEAANLPSEPTIPLEQPEFGSFELNEKDEEEIYRHRHRQFSHEESIAEETLTSSEENSPREPVAPPLPETSAPESPEKEEHS